MSYNPSDKKKNKKQVTAKPIQPTPKHAPRGPSSSQQVRTLRHTKTATPSTMIRTGVAERMSRMSTLDDAGLSSVVAGLNVFGRSERDTADNEPEHNQAPSSSVPKTSLLRSSRSVVFEIGTPRDSSESSMPGEAESESTGYNTPRSNPSAPTLAEPDLDGDMIDLDIDNRVLCKEKRTMTTQLDSSVSTGAALIGQVNKMLQAVTVDPYVQVESFFLHEDMLTLNYSIPSKTATFDNRFNVSAPCRESSRAPSAKRKERPSSSESDPESSPSLVKIQLMRRSDGRLLVLEFSSEGSHKLKIGAGSDEEKIVKILKLEKAYLQYVYVYDYSTAKFID